MFCFSFLILATKGNEKLLKQTSKEPPISLDEIIEIDFITEKIQQTKKRKQKTVRSEENAETLKDPCASSDSSVIDLRQKTNLASPTPQAPALVSQPPSSSFLPPFPALLLPNLYQYNKFPT